jgi:DNA-binding LytR/AlgR family response regulator
MSRKYKVLVVEDDPIIAEDLQAYMEEFGYEGLKPAGSADDALKSIKMNQPDLCLLDVHLDSEINGIQLARLIQSEWDIPLIFLTAFNDRETIEQIKKIGPAGYLVKPVEERNLQTTIELALSNHNANVSKEVNEEKQSDSIFIKVKDQLVKFDYNEILYFEAYDNYAFLHTEKKKHILSSSLKQLEERISNNRFMRSHRSFIINLDKVDGIMSRYVVVNKQEIPIGKTYREKLMLRIDTL